MWPEDFSRKSASGVNLKCQSSWYQTRLETNGAEPVDYTVRALDVSDVDLVTSYFLDADKAYLRNMGIDPAKLPSAEIWQRLIVEDLARPSSDKLFYFLVWEIDGTPIGHANINRIALGVEAYMHLHVWRPRLRGHGHGTQFVRASLRPFFETFDLKSLFCEPYALNESPNRTLAKAGFTFIKAYKPPPGWINFPQTVNRWGMSREAWEINRKSW